MPQPARDSLAGGFDEGLVDADGGRGDGFEVEVGVVATGGEGFAEAALEEPLGKTEFIEKITLLGLVEPGGRCDGCGHSVPLKELDERGDSSIVGVWRGCGKTVISVEFEPIHSPERNLAELAGFTECGRSEISTSEGCRIDPCRR